MGAVATLGHSATSPRANRVPKVLLVVGRLTRREPPFELEKCEMETKEQRQSGKTCASSPPFDDGDSLSVPGMKLCDLGHPLRLGSGVRDGSVGRDGGDGRGGEGWLDGSGSRAIISPRLQPQLTGLAKAGGKRASSPPTSGSLLHDSLWTAHVQS